MRSPAQVQELAVPVHRDHFVVGKLLEPLQLEGVVGEELPSLLLGDLPALEGEVLLHHLAHLGFDALEIFWGEGLGNVEIVIEALVDGRPESDAGGGDQLPHSRGQHVGRGVSQEGQGLRVP